MTATDDTAWQQLTFTCNDWQTAEHAAITVLGPMLAAAQDAGGVRSWWYVRKGPTWRVRLETPADGLTGHLIEVLAETGGASTATRSIYEPETTRFGGPAAMDVAHQLFAADSRRLLGCLAQHGPRLRRELPVILATRLLRAARQDWYEQGDVWEQMAAHRHDSRTPALEPDAESVSALETLLAAEGDTPGSPLRTWPDWPGAFEEAGRQIAALASRGALVRGQREILAQHLIFLFNRHGVSGGDQDALAAAARQAIFGTIGGQAADTSPNAARPAARVTTVGAVTATADTADDSARAAQLRNELADRIRSWGIFKTSRIEEAFRTVSRHHFLPDHPLEEAYSPKPVVTQRAADGTSTSSASLPNLVAGMLEQLQPQPGGKILEVGAATGFNAALLAFLTGPGGHVATIEYDAGLAAQAAANLTRAGYPDVEVITGDGTLGHQPGAPYDGIIVTAEATDITAAWWDQLADGGRVVAPARLHGSGLTRAIGLRRTGTSTMTTDSPSLVCGFVGMRGSTQETGQQIRLAEGAVLKVDSADLPDAEALSRVLDSPPDQRWTGIRVRRQEPAEHLDLWLCSMIMRGHGAGTCFSRLAVTPGTRESGLADPAMRWAGAGLYQDDSLAWITARPTAEDVNELGIDARGPGSGKVAEALHALLAEWDRQRPGQPVITATRAPAEPEATPDAARVTRPVTTFAITW